MDNFPREEKRKAKRLLASLIFHDLQIPICPPPRISAPTCTERNGKYRKYKKVERKGKMDMRTEGGFSTWFVCNGHFAEEEKFRAMTVGKQREQRAHQVRINFYVRAGSSRAFVIQTEFSRLTRTFDCLSLFRVLERNDTSLGRIFLLALQPGVQYKYRSFPLIIIFTCMFRIIVEVTRKIIQIVQDNNLEEIAK